ncbi:hypothetical protein AURDEDRAFT_129872 [Auricularia subglabra TFB-10046 SS5]|nr:hypothetical protein AURDEDRAFT_129872 [Auricularia subglabra TFB-10046 SS5]
MSRFNFLGAMHLPTDSYLVITIPCVSVNGVAAFPKITLENAKLWLSYIKDVRSRGEVFDSFIMDSFRQLDWVTILREGAGAELAISSQPSMDGRARSGGQPAVMPCSGALNASDDHPPEEPGLASSANPGSASHADADGDLPVPGIEILVRNT